MKLIPLSGRLGKGKFAIVDDEDFDELSKMNWGASQSKKIFYAKAWQGKVIRMHRYLMKVTDKNMYVDHIDGDGLNNKKNNLRLATISQNNMNRSSAYNSSSKYKGVCLIKRNEKWLSYIRVNKILLNLGSFNTEEEAAIRYNEAAKIHHGEFAKINII